MLMLCMCISCILCPGSHRSMKYELLRTGWEKNLSDMFSLTQFLVLQLILVIIFCKSVTVTFVVDSVLYLKKKELFYHV